MDIVTLQAARAAAKRDSNSSYEKLNSDARKTSLLRMSYTRLATRDVLPFDWLTIGDSTTEGARHTSGLNRWTYRSVKQLRQRLAQTTTGGYGYVPAWYSTGDQQSVSPVSFVSTAGNTGSGQSRGSYGLGRRCLAMGGGTDKSVLTLTAGTASACTSVDVIYARTTNATSGIDIYLDGSLVTSITTSSASPQSGLRYRLSNLNGASHTIEVRATGAIVYFEGFMLYNGDENSGIRLWDGSSSGSNSAYHAAISASSKGTPNFIYAWDDWVAIQPSLVTVMLGINDYYNGSSQTQTPAQYGQNLNNIVQNIKAACTTPPGIIFIPQWERGSVPTGISNANNWLSYVNQIYQVASDNSALIFDASLRFPAGVQTTALNLINSDFTHNTDTGSAFLADSFVNWFLPK